MHCEFIYNDGEGRKKGFNKVFISVRKQDIVSYYVSDIFFVS